MKRAQPAAVALLVLGALLLFLARSRDWATVRVPVADQFPRTAAALAVSVPGGEVAGGLGALAVAALAAAAAVVATARRGRLLVAALIVAVGAGAVALTVSTLTGLHRTAPLSTAVTRVSAPAANRPAPLVVGDTGWPWLALTGGLLLVGAGALVVAGAVGDRGAGRGAAGLPARYAAPAAEGDAASAPVALDAEAATWSALDRGEDPTVQGAGGTGGSAG